MATRKQSLEELLSVVPLDVLDHPCNDDHLQELAYDFPGWREVAYFLKLTDVEVEEVEAGISAEMVRVKGLRMLRKWRTKCGEQATYRVLCSTLWKLGRVDMVEKITDLLQSQPPSTQVPPTEAPFSQASTAQAQPYQAIPAQAQPSVTAHNPSALRDPNLDSVSKASLLPASKFANEEVCATYTDYLKYRYGLNMPGCTIQSPLPPTEVYFDLALIERTKRERAADDRRLTALAMEGRVVEMMEKRTPVKLEDIFTLDAKRRKVILIEGVPGSGKTTLSWHICQQWEARDLFPQFQFVVYVQLRDPIIQAAQSVVDLLPRTDEQMAQDIFVKMKARNGEGILFVLDGWDELPGDLPKESPIRQLVEPAMCTPLQRSAVIITSRPEASSHIRHLATSRIQIVGFTPNRVEEYFTESLQGDPEGVKALIEHVNEQPAIQGICSLPLNAAIIVTLFLSTGQLPTTLTGLFVALVLHCILRHCKARTNLKVRSLHSLDSLPAEVQEAFSSLCVLAFEGVLDNKIQFTENEVGLHTGFATLSLLQVVESFVTIGSVRTYHFLHLSVQELLAAYHISRMPPDAQGGIVLGLFGHERFPGVFQFYAGFTGFREAWSRDIFNVMVESKNALEVNLLFQCLHEAQDPALYKFLADHISFNHLDLDFQLNPVAYHSLGCVLAQVSRKDVVIHLDEQGMILVCKGFQKGWAANPMPQGGPKLCLYIQLQTHDGTLQSITHLFSLCGISRFYMSFAFHPPMNVQFILRCIGEKLADNHSIDNLVLAVDRDVSNHLAEDTSIAGYELGTALSTNQTLQTLRLKVEWAPLDTVSIARGLMANLALKTLELGKCSITDHGAKSLASMLAVNKTLTKLELSDSHISPEGLCYLAEGLKHNSTLKFLKLSAWQMSLGIQYLADALTANTTVRLPSEELTAVSINVLGDLCKELMADGVLQKLLTVAIEQTVSEFGEDVLLEALTEYQKNLNSFTYVI